MTGSHSGTSGDKLGTNGVVPWPLLLAIGGFLLAVVLVNIASSMTEMPHLAVWEPVSWEMSSYIAIMIQVPALYCAWHRFPWQRLGLLRFTGLMAVLAIIYSALHIVLMVVIRDAVYGLMHQHYDFARHQLGVEIIYEFRKDMLSFAVIIGMVWVDDRMRAKATLPVAPARLEVKADGRMLYLDPAEILLVEAAGNYVELHRAETKMLLVRGTLAEFAGKLGPQGFVRVHRSRLVNRNRIASFEGTPSGDLRIIMDNGRELSGSRRYRENLKAAA